MRRRVPIFISGFLAGVGAETFLGWGWPAAVFCAALAAGLAVLFLAHRREPVFIFAAIFLFAAGLGVWRFTLAVPAADPALELLLGRPAALAGVVAAEPDDRQNNALLTVKLAGRQTKVLVTLARGRGFLYGDEVRVSGRLERPRNFLTDTGKKFDYIGYLRGRGILYLVKEGKVELVAPGRPSLPRALFTLKNRWLEKTRILLPDPAAALAAGLVVGEQSGLGPEWQKIFRQSGLTHIVVLSGYNLTLVSESILKFFAFFLPRFWSLALGGAGVVLFTLMTGGAAATVRAAIMALILILSRLTGRISHAGWALLLTAFVMVLVRPLILVFDVGFQLSILATLGLIYLAPGLERRLSRLPRFLNLRGIAASTLAAQFFVLPLLLYRTGNLSLWILPANLLVLVVIPAAMFFSFLAGAVGLLSVTFAQPLAWLSYLLLAYQLKVAEWFAFLPGAALAVPAFPWWLVFAVYLGLGYLLSKIIRGGSQNKAV